MARFARGKLNFFHRLWIFSCVLPFNRRSGIQFSVFSRQNPRNLQHVSGFQPEIVVVDRLHQNRLNPRAVCSQHICIDLISHKSAIYRRYVVLLKTLPNPFGKGFLCVSNARKPPFLTENLYPLLMAVGYHTELNLRCLHSLQPSTHSI